MCEEKFNLYGVNATTHPCTTLIIVNGPVAKELKMNSGHNAFGPGNQANATIGRAVRLAMLNIGGAIPGAGDMATFGTPAKYTFCAAENEDASPWEPLHVELGFARDVSTVTVFGAEGQHNVNDHESVTGVGVLKMMAGVIATTGANDLYFDGGPAVIFGPEHAATIAKDGYSKADVKKYLYEHGRVALGKLSDENVERRIRQWPVFKNEFMEAGPERLIPVMKSPDNISIIVLGGAGKHSAYIPTFGATQSVTLPLKRRNGEFARSVDDFRSGVRTIANTASSAGVIMGRLIASGHGEKSGVTRRLLSSACLRRRKLPLRSSIGIPKLREFFLAAGYEPAADPPARFQKRFHADLKRWAEIARVAKIAPQ